MKDTGVWGVMAYGAAAHFPHITLFLTQVSQTQLLQNEPLNTLLLFVAQFLNSDLAAVEECSLLQHQ